jgi:hypothetical protein
VDEDRRMTAMLAFPIIKELNLPSDPCPDLNKLESNLCILKCNAMGSSELWLQFLMHLCWPEEQPVPEALFLQEITTNRHYKLAMDAISALYPY